MKLLILTQKVDQTDDVLGFFHGWLKEFSHHFEKITVIALGVGVYSLPENVSVYSLGKEKGVSKITYILRYYRYILRERRQYDTVFVHMNPEYVVMGGLIWRLLGKKLLLWYNHPEGNIWIKIASVFPHFIFHTSPYAFAKKYKKAKVMPAGIDTEIFKRDTSLRKENSILSLGRIARIKNTHLITKACENLFQEGNKFTLSVYGNPGEKDKEYYDEVKRETTQLENESAIEFYPAISNTETPKIYNSHEIFINATKTGSFDKAILEAMACEEILVLINRSFSEVVPQSLLADESSEKLSEALRYALTMTPLEKRELGKKLREYVVANHSLKKLSERLISFT